MNGWCALTREPGVPVGRAARGHREAVGAGLLRLRQLAGGRLGEAVVQAEEGRPAEEGEGGQIAPRHGQEPGIDLLRVLGRVPRHAGCVAVEDAAQGGREVALIARVQHLLHPHVGVEDVARHAARALDAGLLAAGGDQAVLNRGEVVLRLRIAQAVGGVGVGLAEDVRYAEAVPTDAHVIAARRRGSRRLPRSLRRADARSDQEAGRREGEQQATTDRCGHTKPPNVIFCDRRRPRPQKQWP